MSNEELEVYVALVAKFLHLSPEQRDLISGELQDHLQMRVEDLIHEGVSGADAISQAVDEFGDAAVMAKNFQTVHNLKRRRWMMRFMTFSIAGSFLVAVLTMAMWPQEARFGSLSKSIAQQNDNPESLFDDLDAGSDNPFGNPARKPKPTLSEPAPKPKPTVLKAAPNVDPTASKSTQLNQRAEAALKKPVDFNFDNAPFVEIVEMWEESTGLNFILTTSATDDSLTEDETITSRLNGLPLGKAIDLILAPKNATYVIDSGVVLFISLDEASDEKWFRVKMFDCRELVKVLPKTAPPVKLLQSRPPGGSGKGGGVFSIASPNQSAQTQTAKSDSKKQIADKKPSESQLLDAKLQRIMSIMEQEATRRRPAPSGEYTLETLVHSMTESDAWCEPDASMIKAVNGILIVRNSESMLKQIEDLLVDLEGKLVTKRP